MADVNALQATRAQPVSVRCLWRPVVPLTTPCATAEGNASVTAVSVMRDTSVHNAGHASAVLTLARPNCKESKLLLNFYFQILVKGSDHQITKKMFQYLVITERPVAPLLLSINCRYKSYFQELHRMPRL